MMVLPINFIGTLKSLGQAIGGRRLPSRTPKVQKRTVAPLAFIIIPLVIVDWSGVTLFNDILGGRYLHAGFAGLNAFCTVYAMAVLYGVRSLVADFFVNVGNWVYRPVEIVNQPQPVADWMTVLYHGTAVRGETAELSRPRARLRPSIRSRPTAGPSCSNPGTSIWRLFPSLTSRLLRRFHPDRCRVWRPIPSATMTVGLRSRRRSRASLDEAKAWWSSAAYRFSDCWRSWLSPRPVAAFCGCRGPVHILV